jgi:hypothetical protein
LREPEYETRYPRYPDCETRLLEKSELRIQRVWVTDSLGLEIRTEHSPPDCGEQKLLKVEYYRLLEGRDPQCIAFREDNTKFLRYVQVAGAMELLEHPIVMRFKFSDGSYEESLERYKNA